MCTYIYIFMHKYIYINPGYLYILYGYINGEINCKWVQKPPARALKSLAALFTCKSPAQVRSRWCAVANTRFPPAVSTATKSAGSWLGPACGVSLVNVLRNIFSEYPDGEEVPMFYMVQHAHIVSLSLYPSSRTHSLTHSPPSLSTVT